MLNPLFFSFLTLPLKSKGHLILRPPSLFFCRHEAEIFGYHTFSYTYFFAALSETNLFTVFLCLFFCRLGWIIPSIIILCLLFCRLRFSKKITLMRQSIGMKSTENKNTTHNILSSVHFLLKRGKWTYVIGVVHSVQI